MRDARIATLARHIRDQLAPLPFIELLSSFEKPGLPGDAQGTPPSSIAVMALLPGAGAAWACAAMGGGMAGRADMGIPGRMVLPPIGFAEARFPCSRLALF